MRLPDLSGYRLEQLIGEDPFGWSFLAGNNRGVEKRLIRIFKSQATREEDLADLYRRITTLPNAESIARVEQFSPRVEGMPSSISVQFPGWESQKSGWHLSSVASLSKLIDRDSARSSCALIIHALGDLHRQGVNHGGLLPSNIFLTGQGDEPVVKVAGFGEMVMEGLQHVEASSLPFYLAPEQMIHTVTNEEKVAQWDVYSTGVILFQLLCKHLPRLDRLFQQFRTDPEPMEKLVLVAQGKLTRNANQIYQLLESEKEIIWPDQHQTESERVLRAIIEKCLAFNPHDRFKDLTQTSDALRKAEALLADKEAKAKAQAVAQAQPVVTPTEPIPVAAPPTTPPPPTPETQPVSEHPAMSAHVNVDLTDNKITPDPATAPEPKKKSKKRKKAPVAKSGDSLDELFDLSSNDDEDGFVAKVPFVRAFRGSGILDKGVAVLLFAGMVALGALTFLYHNQLVETEANRRKAVADLRANILRQESAYKEKIAEKVRAQENLKDNLNQVEDTKAQLISETSNARRLLRKAQDNSDQFFRLVLENRDSDVPWFREQRKIALGEGLKHYQYLAEVYGEAPEFYIQKTHAYYYMGRILREMGNFDAASQAFAAAESRYETLMDEERNSIFAENMAISKRSLGELAFENESYAEASRLYADSSKHWQETRMLDSSKGLTVAIEVNNNSLQIVKCHQKLGNIQTALDGAGEIASQFLSLQDRFPNNERISGGLGNAFLVLGEIYESSKDKEKASNSYQQAGNLFARAIQQNSAVDDYHLGLGKSLAKIGIMSDDDEKIKSAITVLSQVAGRNPYEAEFLRTLNQSYAYLSSKQRNGGKLTNAITLEQEAIGILGPMIRSHPDAPADVIFAYAERLVHIAQLKLDANKFNDSRPPLKEAIEVLGEITDREDSKPQYRRTLASARGLAGFSHYKSKDYKTAKTYYSLAVADWQTYLAQNPNDADAVDEAGWAKNQLKALP